MTSKTAHSRDDARATSPLAVSDLFDLMPAFLSHHPDHAEPESAQPAEPWGRR